MVEKEILLTFLSSLSSTGSNLGRSLTTCQTVDVPFLKLGHLKLMCLDCHQWKQSPFSMHLFCSLVESFPTLMMSTSMASGSLALVEVEKE